MYESGECPHVKTFGRPAPSAAVRRVHAREYCYAPNLSYYAPRFFSAAKIS